MTRNKEPLVSDVVRELHHYTSIKGLKGIVDSQQLRATRFDHLNDATEVRHFYDDLRESVRRLLSRSARQRSKENREFRTRVAQAGGIRFVSQNDAANLVRRFFEVTFEGDSQTPAFAVPFIASFCSHGSDDHLHKEKWPPKSVARLWDARRAVCVGLDVKKLEARLSEEVGKHQYSFLNISDVVYNTADLDFDDRFMELIELMELDWAKHALGEGLGAPEHIFNKFIECAVRLKHQAFREEREFRVVACPMSEQLDNFFKQELGAHSSRNLPIKTIDTDEVGRPYVALFRGSSKTLPIKRIIVGPHPKQGELVAEAKAIVRNSIPVYASKTPYIG